MANKPEQTNFRKHDETKDFSIISNAAWRDPKLSIEARGVLISIIMLPKDWLFNRIWAMREFKIGKKKLDQILRELREAGYMVYVRPKDEQGRMQAGYYLYAANPKSLPISRADPEEDHHKSPQGPCGVDHKSPAAPGGAGTGSRKGAAYKSRISTQSESKPSASGGFSSSRKKAAPSRIAKPARNAPPADRSMGSAGGGFLGDGAVSAAEKARVAKLMADFAASKTINKKRFIG